MKQYQTVRLKTGESACIVDILEDGKAYLADIDHSDGTTSTEYVMQEEIED
ncbi:hypothetical protein OBV_18060 [Oscillibacter valericigenes Sjm18-20]|nr:hypothetical protein OBV_18060 [Oscillibacter valericigenes Sjm18-20]